MAKQIVNLVNDSTVVYDGPCRIKSIEVVSATSAHAISVYDGTSLFFTIPASQPAKRKFDAIQDAIFETSLVIDPNNSATGTILVEYEELNITSTKYDEWPASTVIESAELKSSVPDSGGISNGSFGASQPAFSSNGVTFSSDNAISFALNTISPSLYEKLRTGGRIKFYVETDGIITDYAPGAAEYLVSTNSGYIRKQTNGRLEVRMPNASPTLATPSDGGSVEIADYYVGSALKGTFTEVIIAWNEQNQYLFIDGLPIKCVSGARPIDTLANIQTLNFGSLTSTTLSFNGYAMNGLEISCEPYYYSRHPDYGRVLFLGDSFTTQGAIDNRMNTTAFVPWDPGFGYDAGGAASSGSNRNLDGGVIPQFVRELIKAGINTSQSTNEAESGDNAGACDTRCTNFFSGGGEADIACLQIGTNDVAQSTAQATFRANMRSIIDTLDANGVKKIVVGNVISLRNFATYQTDAFNTQTDVINSEISELVDYNSKVTLVNNFAKFGGHNFDTGDFESNDIHPSQLGSSKLGQFLGQGMVSAIQR